MMPPDSQAALLAEFHAALPRILDGTEDRTWLYPRHANPAEQDFPPETDFVSEESVMEAVIMASGITRERLMGTRRLPEIVGFRHMAYALMAEFCKHMTVSRIARLMGRDARSIDYGIAAYKKRRLENLHLRAIEARACAIIGVRPVWAE